MNPERGCEHKIIDQKLNYTRTHTNTKIGMGKMEIVEFRALHAC